MTDSPDLRGIDVALLYQRDLFKLLSFPFCLYSALKQFRPTRDLLHVSGLLLTGDTLDVFVCHLPSRSGGAKNPNRTAFMQPEYCTQRLTVFSTYGFIHKLSLWEISMTIRPINLFRKILEAESPPPTAPSPLKLYHLLARKAQSKNFRFIQISGRMGITRSPNCIRFST